MHQGKYELHMDGLREDRMVDVQKMWGYYKNSWFERLYELITKQ